MTEAEVWKPIDGVRGYFVSNQGRVRKDATSVPTVYGAKRVVRARFLTGNVLNTGYLQVMLPGRKKVSVHRLVAIAFCDGYSDSAVVNHKDGNKLNNAAENLEWVSMAENNLHSFRVLKRKPSYLGKFGGSHSTSKAVVRRCKLTGFEVRYESAMDAVREGFDSSGISRCCQGKIGEHKGYLWTFA
jgi:hypothetical protein